MLNRILLDTCALIWLIKGQYSKLGSDAQSILEDEAVQKLVSPISFWEIANKSSKPKNKGTEDEICTQDEFRNLIMEAMDLYALRLLDLRLDHTEHLYELQYFDDHKDPFDRIFISEAIIEDAFLLSSDSKLDYYGFVEVYKNVWL